MKPRTYELLQNYPNPFNAMTRISYSIPSSDFLILKVYDILGRELHSLVNSFKKEGEYSVLFDAANLSSGIYLYKLKVGKDFMATKRMLFIR
jgi:hypothetical protein